MYFSPSLWGKIKVINVRSARKQRSVSRRGALLLRMRCGTGKRWEVLGMEMKNICRANNEHLTDVIIVLSVTMILGGSC